MLKYSDSQEYQKADYMQVYIYVFIYNLVFFFVLQLHSTSFMRAECNQLWSEWNIIIELSVLEGFIYVCVYLCVCAIVCVLCIL